VIIIVLVLVVLHPVARNFVQLLETTIRNRDATFTAPRWKTSHLGTVSKEVKKKSIYNLIKQKYAMRCLDEMCKPVNLLL
jgi:hypothetical protein